MPYLLISLVCFVAGAFGFLLTRVGGDSAGFRSKYEKPHYQNMKLGLYVFPFVGGIVFLIVGVVDVFNLYGYFPQTLFDFFNT